MIRILTLLIIAGVFGGLCYWLSLNSGSIIFSVLGYQIETTVTLAVIAVIFAVTVINIAIKFATRVFLIPNKIKVYLNDLKIRQITNLQTKLINTLCLKDPISVKNYASKLTSSVKNAQYEQTQIYKILAIDHADKVPESIYINISNNSKTIYLIKRTEFFKVNSDWDSIISLLKDEFLKNTKFKNQYLARSLVQSFVRLNRWQELLQFVEKCSKNLTKEQSKHLYVIARYNLIKKLVEDGKVKQSIEELNDILKLLPDFYYSFILIIELVIKYHIKDNLIKIIEHSFNFKQNSRITSVITQLSTLYSSQELYNLALNLRFETDQSYESKIIFIQFALNYGMFDEAYKELSYCLNIKGKTQRLCLLMAEFCQRTHSNSAECLEWIKNSLTCTNDISRDTLYLNVKTLTITEDSVDAIALI